MFAVETHYNDEHSIYKSDSHNGNIWDQDAIQ